MAIVRGAFFATWASGSIKKTMTVRWLGNGNRFVLAKYKSRAGKRSEKQIYNSQVFKERVQTFYKIRKRSWEE